MRLVRIRRLIVFLLFALTLSGALGMAVWFFGRPLWLTWLHGDEMTVAVQQFRETELALETRLQPNLILSVAIEDYLPTFMELNHIGKCEACDRFWVTTSAEVTQIQVMEYSLTYAQAWAKVVTWGHMVDSRTYESLRPYEAPLEDEAVYIFVRDSASNLWLLQSVSGFTVPHP